MADDARSQAGLPSGRPLGANTVSTGWRSGRPRGNVWTVSISLRTPPAALVPVGGGRVRAVTESVAVIARTFFGVQRVHGVQWVQQVLLVLDPTLALTIFGAGAVAGALGVALGLGGGIFLVPFLTLALGFPLKSDRK